jgi:hypothetical protein
VSGRAARTPLSILAGVYVTLTLVAGVQSAAEADRSLRVQVRVHPVFPTPARDLARAQRTAGAMLESAGVAIDWLDCSLDGARPPAHECEEIPRSDELVLRLLAAPSRGTRDALGYAYVDIDRRQGTLATVHVDRVQALADEAWVERGRLLGLAIAHELVHLLTGSVAHTRDGLMRASWSVDELRRDGFRRWSIARDEAARLRRGLQARVGPEWRLAVDWVVHGTELTLNR